MNEFFFSDRQNPNGQFHGMSDKEILLAYGLFTHLQQFYVLGVNWNA